jgi:6-phosphofructokinase
VAVLAEGIGLRLPPDELARAMPEVERDEHGHVRLAELELDRLLAKQVKDRFKQRGQKVTVEGKNIGYELRCAPPIPFDIEYTRDLGYGAVDYLKRVLEGDEPGGMVTSGRSPTPRRGGYGSGWSTSSRARTRWPVST